MSLSDRVRVYVETQKLNGGKISSMSFIRENFDEITKLISVMKNQGNGSAYETISKWCFEEGIKTKDGKPLSHSYINDCLIKVRKERGIRIRSSIKQRTSRKSREQLSHIYINEEIFEYGKKKLKEYFNRCVEAFSKPERNNRKMDLTDEEKRWLKLHYSTLTENLRYEGLVKINSDLSHFKNQVAFYEAHKDIFGIK